MSLFLARPPTTDADARVRVSEYPADVPQVASAVHPPPAALRAALAVSAISGGAALSCQTVINRALARSWGDRPLWATFVSFSVGTLLLIVVVGAEARQRRLRLCHFSARPRWWAVLPGAIGVLFVALNTSLVGILGASLLSVCVVVGQLCAAAAMDAAGLGGTGVRVPLSRVRCCALAVAVVGALLAVLDRLGSPAASGAALGALVVAAAASGSLTVVQAALNRGVAALLPSKLQTTLMSFGLGTIYAVIAFGLALAVEPPNAPPLAAYPNAAVPAAWWHYTGGALGAYYIAVSVYVTPVLGSATYFVCVVGGQLVSSAVIDSVGAFDSPVIAIDAARACGVALVVVAASATQLPAGACSSALPGAAKQLSEGAASGSSGDSVDGSSDGTGRNAAAAVSGGTAEERAAFLWAAPEAERTAYRWAREEFPS